MSLEKLPQWHRIPYDTIHHMTPSTIFSVAVAMTFGVLVVAPIRSLNRPHPHIFLSTDSYVIPPWRVPHVPFWLCLQYVHGDLQHNTNNKTLNLRTLSRKRERVLAESTWGPTTHKFNRLKVFIIVAHWQRKFCSISTAFHHARNYYWGRPIPQIIFFIGICGRVWFRALATLFTVNE
jgi:hypothetical protein